MVLVHATLSQVFSWTAEYLYQGEIFVEESELVALEAREGLADVAADPGKVRLVAVERQDLLVRHDPRPIPLKVGEAKYLFGVLI